jgi:hypothetical protein
VRLSAQESEVDGALQMCSINDATSWFVVSCRELVQSQQSLVHTEYLELTLRCPAGEA